jgi:hypothetical protein
MIENGTWLASFGVEVGHFGVVLAGAGGCFVLLLVLFADGEGFSVVFAEGF